MTQKAMKTRSALERDMELAHRGDRAAADRISQRDADYNKAIKPLINQKAKIYMFAKKTFILKGERIRPPIYHFTEEQKQSLELIDTMIDQIKKSIYGLTGDNRA